MLIVKTDMYASQFSKYMCHRNRAVRLSSDESDSYDKKLQKTRIMNYRSGRIIIFQINITEKFFLMS